MRAFLALAAVLAITAPAAAQPLVVIDPGHGGSDPGAVGCSIEEEDVVLDVSQRLQVLLERDGIRIAMTRDADTTVGLSARATFANSRGATGFVSIHSNSNGGTPATGTETFVYPGSNARTRALGQGVQSAMIAAWGLRDRGLKEGNFAVVRETTMPAALGELAFTNNCTTDARFLSDPAQRQRMAEHLRTAILSWLGVSPMPTTGTLRGVVFEDQGVGTEDITVRIGGASVRVTETGASATSAAADGAWSFTVPPGEYTVEASHAGHVTASRRCAVVSGMTTWCSIGLLPESTPPPPDAGSVGEEDAGVIEEVDAGGEERDAATIGGDAGARRDGGTTGREMVDGGCSVGHGSGSSAWLAMILAGLVVAMRRRRAPVALLAAIAMVGCAREAAPAAHESDLRGIVDDQNVAPSARIGARPVASFATLGARREWLAEDLVTPVLSPDGTRALLASPDHTALFVLELDGTSTVRELCRVGRCGWEPQWQDEGAAVAFRTEGQSGTAVPAEAVSLEDGRGLAVRVGERGVHAWTDEDDRAWLRIDGRVREIGPEGERVMMPALTSDRRHVVMWGLTEGVLIHRVRDGAIVHAGPGGHPRVDPSGRWLVFERTEDDGHDITRSDLFVVDLADPGYAIAPLVQSDDRLERMPSLSRIEGGAGTLAYVEDGALIVREVRFARAID
ncbi:N-acetylmuramoyl-L-alanine amidase family protein [Sandaracinus amylolyticus]|uniref:N-acetylmuramoyl-L-alanine amidase family protein n=1 Tax=Sandaracinus amylolyticus TaxID=927083 RepID=UPI001F3DF3C9|nr:N-acetylmuramoyl-L-alanine amidase [Sandaracinus amylolyticus]UJR84818.1 Hypothetical protein I5071_68970 [Sandaracinus amylolyticus]